MAELSSGSTRCPSFGNRLGARAAAAPTRMAGIHAASISAAPTTTTPMVVALEDNSSLARRSGSHAISVSDYVLALNVPKLSSPSLASVLNFVMQISESFLAGEIRASIWQPHGTHEAKVHRSRSLLQIIDRFITSQRKIVQWCSRLPISRSLEQSVIRISRARNNTMQLTYAYCFDSLL